MRGVCVRGVLKTNSRCLFNQRVRSFACTTLMHICVYVSPAVTFCAASAEAAVASTSARRIDICIYVQICAS